MLTKFILVGIVVAGLGGCTSAPPPVNDIPANIADARSPMAHQQIADYFESKARTYDAEAARHDMMARAYANRTRGDAMSMASHCRALRAQFNAAAQEARALALLHRQVAAKGGN